MTQVAVSGGAGHASQGHDAVAHISVGSALCMHARREPLQGLRPDPRRFRRQRRLRVNARTEGEARPWAMECCSKRGLLPRFKGMGEFDCLAASGGSPSQAFLNLSQARWRVGLPLPADRAYCPAGPQGNPLCVTTARGRRATPVRCRSAPVFRRAAPRSWR